MQEVLVFTIVHVLLPSDTLELVIFEPPFDAGNFMVTFTFTRPSFGAEEAIAEIIGAEGFAIFAFADNTLDETALDGDAEVPVTSETVATNVRNLRIIGTPLGPVLVGG